MHSEHISTRFDSHMWTSCLSHASLPKSFVVLAVSRDAPSDSSTVRRSHKTAEDERTVHPCRTTRTSPGWLGQQGETRRRHELYRWSRDPEHRRSHALSTAGRLLRRSISDVGCAGQDTYRRAARCTADVSARLCTPGAG